MSNNTSGGTTVLKSSRQYSRGTQRTTYYQRNQSLKVNNERQIKQNDKFEKCDV